MGASDRGKFQYCVFEKGEHLLGTPAYRQELWHRFQIWQEITASALAA